MKPHCLHIPYLPRSTWRLLKKHHHRVDWRCFRFAATNIKRAVNFAGNPPPLPWAVCSLPLPVMTAWHIFLLKCLTLLPLSSFLANEHISYFAEIVKATRSEFCHLPAIKSNSLSASHLQSCYQRPIPPRVHQIPSLSPYPWLCSFLHLPLLSPPLSYFLFPPLPSYSTIINSLVFGSYPSIYKHIVLSFTKKTTNLFLDS